jgi:spore coat protein JB
MMEKEREKLLQYISEVSFALDDCILFLDTHPNNEEALEYYHKYNEMRNEAREEYENCFGPLTNRGVVSDNMWTWVAEKWPWEGGY